MDHNHQFRPQLLAGHVPFFRDCCDSAAIIRSVNVHVFEVQLLLVPWYELEVHVPALKMAHTT